MVESEEVQCPVDGQELELAVDRNASIRRLDHGPLHGDDDVSKKACPWTALDLVEGEGQDVRRLVLATKLGVESADLSVVGEEDRDLALTGSLPLEDLENSLSDTAKRSAAGASSAPANEDDRH